MRVSLITTVLNEEKTIGEFLESVCLQTRLPDEVIITDAKSTDNTVKVIQSSKLKVKSYNVKFKIISKPGNRAVGRNEAIKHATGDIIVCSDGDCVLDKNWIKNIISPFTDKKVDVVAGYYKGMAETVFQKCLIPYVLVMSDRLDPDNFLPASRTMAFRKNIWESAGGFPQEYNHNEDYVFARKLKKLGRKIVFTKNAIIYWRPRKSLGDSILMFFRFAYGDAEAGIMRARVQILFIRYFLGIFLFYFALFFRSLFLFKIIFLSIVAYFIWSILKNYRYVKNVRALYILPILQLLADIAVISGTIGGGIKRWDIRKKQ